MSSSVTTPVEAGPATTAVVVPRKRPRGRPRKNAA